MKRTEVFKKLTDICREVFEDEKLIITEETNAQEVAGWDSLTHFSLKWRLISGLPLERSKDVKMFGNW